MTPDTFAEFTPAEREEIAAAIFWFVWHQKRAGWQGNRVWKTLR